MISPLSTDPRATVPSVDPVRQQPTESHERERLGVPGEAAASSQDRVEISAAARAQAGAATEPSDADVESARVALQAGSDLSAGRLHDLRERVRTGYYDQPAAIDRIAASVAADLAGPDAA